MPFEKLYFTPKIGNYGRSRKQFFINFLIVILATTSARKIHPLDMVNSVSLNSSSIISLLNTNYLVTSKIKLWEESATDEAIDMQRRYDRVEAWWRRVGRKRWLSLWVQDEIKKKPRFKRSDQI